MRFAASSAAGRMTERILRELETARAGFLDALAEVDAELVTAPGVVDGWSVRDLVVHVAYWADHGSRALDLAMTGHGDEFSYSTDDTDAMNARVLAEAASVSPDDALAREGSAFDGLRERIARLDAALLAHRLGNGDTVEEVIRYDGPDHYAEHTAHLRAWFGPEQSDGEAEG